MALPGALPLPGGLPSGVLPGAVLPGIPPAAVAADGFNMSQPRTEAEQQALEENELLGALAFSLAEQQAEQGVARRSPAAAQGDAALVEARAALKSQQMEAERAVAAATQQAVQMEAERAAAIAAAAEAMRQRKEAETQLAAQQAQLQQLQQHQHQYEQQKLANHSGQNLVAMAGAQAGQQPASGQAGGGQNVGPCGQASATVGINDNGGQAGAMAGYSAQAVPQPPLPPQPYGDNRQWHGGPGSSPNTPPYGSGGPQGYGQQQQQQQHNPQEQHHHGHHAGQGGGYGGGGGAMHGGNVGHPPQPIVCEFCGRWLSEMALDQGNHMCDEFWSYNAEFQSVGAQCALLIGGVQHLKPDHLQSFAMRFPNMRRVKHGASPGEFNGLFMLTDEQRQTQALRLLANCNVRTIPLGHAASWRCLHVQLAPSSCPQRVGQAEQSLQNQLLRVMQQRQTPNGVSGDSADAPAPGRGQAAADAWAQITWFGLQVFGFSPATGLASGPGLPVQLGVGGWRGSACPIAQG